MPIPREKCLVARTGSSASRARGPERHLLCNHYCCKGILRHRPRRPHPRIRLALPPQGSIWHQNRVKSGNRCRINVESMLDRCQINPEEERARRIRGWGPGGLCLINPSGKKGRAKTGQTKFEPPIRGEDPLCCFSLCLLSWFSGPGCYGALGSKLRLGASDLLP